MSGVDWSSLIAGPDRRICEKKLRSAVAVALALLGGLVAIAAAVMEIALRTPIETGNLWPMVGALVLPLTGGKIMDGVAALAARKQASRDNGGTSDTG